MINYASIAVVEIKSDEIVNIETISVSKGECTLSGAWDFELSDRENISNVVSGKLVVALGEELKVREILSTSNIRLLKIEKFLVEAKTAVINALDSFQTFKSQDLKKRKKMLEPKFFKWPESIDLNFAAKYLDSIGMMAYPRSTPKDSQKILAASRLLQFLIQMWHRDEQERVNRKYIEGLDSEITILPECWLNEFMSIKNQNS